MPNKTVRGSQTTQPRAGKACGRSALRIEGRRFRRTALCVVAFALWLGLASNASGTRIQPGYSRYTRKLCT